MKGEVTQATGDQSVRRGNAGLWDNVKEENIYLYGSRGRILFQMPPFYWYVALRKQCIACSSYENRNECINCDCFRIEKKKEILFQSDEFFNFIKESNINEKKCIKIWKIFLLPVNKCKFLNSFNFNSKC